MPPSTKFRIIATAALLCAVTACTSTPEPADSPAAGPQPGGAPATRSAAPVESSAGAVTAGDACTGEDIRAEATVQKTGVALLAITNASTGACRLTGWPKLGLLAADGSALTVPVREVEQPGPATPSDLDPGETAYAGVKWAACDKAAAGCAVATTLTVAPEGGGSPVAATVIGVEGGSQTVTELPIAALEVGTIQPSPQGVVAW